MRWLAGIAFGIMHVACSGGTSTPDAATVDASTGGLIVEFVGKGGVPQMPTAGVEIIVVRIGMKTIRAIGDAAPGDMRTTRTDRALDWKENTVPVPQLFSQAPPGVYSTIELRVADSTEATAIEVSGRAARGGDLIPFQIQSTAADVALSIPVDTVLVPRAFATTTIELDVAALVAGIDWDAVPLTTDGKLYIGDGDAAMAGVVTRLAGAFRERPPL